MRCHHIRYRSFTAPLLRSKLWAILLIAAPYAPLPVSGGASLPFNFLHTTPAPIGNTWLSYRRALIQVVRLAFMEMPSPVAIHTMT